MPVFDLIVVSLVLLGLSLLVYKIFMIFRRRLQMFYFKAQGHENLVDYQTYKAMKCDRCKNAVSAKTAVYTNKKWFHKECMERKGEKR